MTDTLNRMFSFVLRVALVVLGLVFTLGLMMVGFVLTLILVVAGLVLGRRPDWQVKLRESLLRRARSRAGPQGAWPPFRRPGGAAGPRPRGAGEVIDAEVREVPAAGERS